VSASTLPYAHPTEHAHDPVPGQRLGVILLIAGDAVFVLSLVFTYFYLRGLNTDGAWIPKGSATLGAGSGWVLAGVAVLSALAYRWGELGIRAGERGRLVAGTTLALVLVLADLGLLIGRLATMPFTTTTGSYASTVITMAGAYLVHLLITALLGVAIWNRARRGLFSADTNWHVRLVGYWWSWIAVTAVLLAVTTTFISSPHVGS
jgi:heme/copper-type cytochrome/quinol oxidase subunit 3